MFDASSTHMAAARLLSPDETMALARTVVAARPQGGVELLGSDERSRVLDAALLAREQLVLANTRLAMKAARMFGDGSADDVADALIGLMWAVDRFDPERGFKFSTYAMFWLRKFVSDGRAARQEIRLPGEARSALCRLRAASERLGVSRLDDERVAADAGVAVAMARSLVNASARPLSLDVSVGDRETPFGETIAAQDTQSEPDDPVAREALLAMLGTLPPREQTVIVARFGLDGCGVRTLVQVGRELGVSKQRVSQLELSALARMRARMPEAA